MMVVVGGGVMETFCFMMSAPEGFLSVEIRGDHGHRLVSI